MYPFLIRSETNLLVTTMSNSSWIFDLNDPCSPPFCISATPTSSKKVDSEAHGIILAAAFSNSGNYVACTNDYKEVYLYEMKMGTAPCWTLVSSRDIPKKGVCLKFLSDDKSLLLADKFGDVHLISCVNYQQESQIIMGHLSQLMDIATLFSDKYIATADRDEKIRISHYPNTYNIQAFCLGHSSFVTSLAVADDCLISSSGDGSVKLWDPLSGELLSDLKINVESNGFVQHIIFDKDAKILVCLVSGSAKLVFLSMAEKVLQQLSTTELQGVGLSMTLYNEGVLILQDYQPNPLVHVTFDNFLPKPCFDSINMRIVQNWDKLSEAKLTISTFYTNLVKVNVENIEEEFERRGKRITDEKKKNGEKRVKTSKQCI